MITIKIGALERDLKNADPSWINQQINGLKGDGHPVCVRVNIREGDVHVALTTPACSQAGGGRLPNEQERRIFDLWNKHHLNQADIQGGSVVSFLKELNRVIG